MCQFWLWPENWSLRLKGANNGNPFNAFEATQKILLRPETRKRLYPGSRKPELTAAAAALQLRLSNSFLSANLIWDATMSIKICNSVGIVLQYQSCQRCCISISSRKQNKKLISVRETRYFTSFLTLLFDNLMKSLLKSWCTFSHVCPKVKQTIPKMFNFDQTLTCKVFSLEIFWQFLGPTKSAVNPNKWSKFKWKSWLYQKRSRQGLLEKLGPRNFEAKTFSRSP